MPSQNSFDPEDKVFKDAVEKQNFFVWTSFADITYNTYDIYILISIPVVYTLSSCLLVYSYILSSCMHKRLRSLN